MKLNESLYRVIQAKNDEYKYCCSNYDDLKGNLSFSLNFSRFYIQTAFGRKRCDAQVIPAVASIRVRTHAQAVAQCKRSVQLPAPGSINHARHPSHYQCPPERGSGHRRRERSIQIRRPPTPVRMVSPWLLSSEPLYLTIISISSQTGRINIILQECWKANVEALERDSPCLCQKSQM